MLRVLAMEVTTQEMVVTGVSATNITGRLKDRKTGQSRIPNQTIGFPKGNNSLWSVAQAVGAQSCIFY
jgi:hypothetical protein